MTPKGEELSNSIDKPVNNNVGHYFIFILTIEQFTSFSNGSAYS